MYIDFTLLGSDRLVKVGPPALFPVPFSALLPIIFPVLCPCSLFLFSASYNFPYLLSVLQHNRKVVAVAVTTVFVAVESAFRAGAGVLVVAL